jgi:hypothetical protein
MNTRFPTAAALFLALPSISAGDELRTIHVFVALCDNESQGIAPVPARIGNGDDPANNLYWGSADGLKTVFQQSKDWKLLSSTPKPSERILERCVFERSGEETFLIADAYRGREIKAALRDFLSASAGKGTGTWSTKLGARTVELPLGGGASFVAYIGHNGLMDFQLSLLPKRQGPGGKPAVVLCCKSEQYFAEPLRSLGAKPVLLTRQFMYPGAFLLQGALEGWFAGESPQQIRERAAKAYAANQKIEVKAARGVFSAL